MSRHDHGDIGQVLGVGTGYSVADVARYLQFSPDSIIYWLRTGNLLGERDPRTGEWRVLPQNLVAFLRNTSTAETMSVSLQSDVTLVARDVRDVAAPLEAEPRTAASRRERVLVPAL